MKPLRLLSNTPRIQVTVNKLDKSCLSSSEQQPSSSIGFFSDSSYFDQQSKVGPPISNQLDEKPEDECDQQVTVEQVITEQFLIVGAISNRRSHQMQLIAAIKRDLLWSVVQELLNYAGKNAA